MASRKARNESAYEIRNDQQLVEDLHIHQAELEAQNEELRRAHSELERNKMERDEFFNLSPVGYLTIDESLHIIDANEAAARLFNADVEHLIASNIFGFVPLDSQMVFMKHLKLARENNCSSRQLVPRLRD